ncbi:MAG: hypothetical protein Q9207_007843 [Kuettlingeria erythrocarpa]
MAESHAQHSDALQAFHRWRRSPEAQTPGLGGSDLDATAFISQSKLEAYLAPRVENLLVAVLKPEDRPAVTADYIRRYYLRTFATLLCINEGHWIYSFQQYRSLRDGKMPHMAESEDFPYTEDSELFKKFNAAQWQFCPKYLQYDMKDRFRPQEILPITGKTEIGRGGSATIFQITVDEAYNFLRPEVPGRPSTSSQQPHPNTFVLKTYRRDEAEKHHRIERDAYINLRWAGRPTPNIVAFYGSFIQGTSYNLILEYADRGNLRDFMRRTPKPESVEDVLLFFDRLVDIVQGVQCIHGRIGTTSSASQVLNLNGWHQDIKPANILVFGGHPESPYDCEFKIADLGLAHFKPNDSQAHDPSDLDAFGTRAYGAPETYRHHSDSQSVPLQVTPAVDIWSLGCVFSEAAVWAQYGWRTVKEYQRRRSNEIEKKTKGVNKGEQIFHWDDRILETVRDMHQDILGKTNTAHKVVREIVEKVVGDMLERGSRPHAAFVFEKAKRIIKERADLYDVRLIEPSWRVDAELAGVLKSGTITMEPPQPPPDITPCSSIWSGERGMSAAHANGTATLPDPFVSGDEPPLSLTPSMPDSPIQSGGNYGLNRLSRGNTSLDTKTPTSSQPRPPTLPHDPSSTSTTSPDSRGSAQQHLHREQSSRPTLSLEEGQRWKEKKKRGEHPILPGSENLASLNQRDHIFLVDNSETMRQYKTQIAGVASLLAYIVKDSDDDGLDIHFTQSVYQTNSKKSTGISSAIHQQPYRGIPDMRGRLGSILQEHINRFGALVSPSRSRFGRQRSPQPQKRLSFYVLTDAKWQPGDVGKVIKDLVQRMKAKGLPKEHVGIQFIRFGDDPASIDKLDELDHGLGLNAEGMDIVDHTYWNGNVWKMLLGAVNDWYDDDPP